MKEKSKKGKTAALGLLAALSVAIGGAFDSPVDLVKKDAVLLPAPPAVVQTVTEDPDGEPEDPEQEEQQQEEEETSLRERFRELILRLPLPVRAVLGVPLWGCGQLLERAASALWTLILSPLLSHLLRWLCSAAILLGVLALLMKLLFPNIPWKKLLNRRTLLSVLLFTGLLELADIFVPLFWKDWTSWSRLVRTFTSLLFTGLTALRLYRLHQKITLPKLRTDAA